MPNTTPVPFPNHCCNVTVKFFWPQLGLGGLGPSKESPVKLKACVKVPKYPPVVTLYPPFLKHSWLHHPPTASSSSGSDTSAVLAPALGHSCTVWPEMLLLEGQSWALQPCSVDVHPWGYRSAMCDSGPVTRASEASVPV